MLRVTDSSGNPQCTNNGISCLIDVPRAMGQVITATTSVFFAGWRPYFP